MASHDYITTLGKALKAYVDTQEAIVSAAREGQAAVAQAPVAASAQGGEGENGSVSAGSGAPQ